MFKQKYNAVTERLVYKHWRDHSQGHSKKLKTILDERIGILSLIMIKDTAKNSIHGGM